MLKKLLVLLVFLSVFIFFFSPNSSAETLPQSPKNANQLIETKLLKKTLGGNSLTVFDKDYELGPQDVINITVWDNPDLSGNWAITLNGKINYHFVGEIQAAGLTPNKLALKITKILSNGYLINPQVTVEVLKYLSKKVFIIGEVKNPGTYYLKKITTLVEIISQAGGTNKDADREIVIVRPKRIGASPEDVSHEDQKIYIDFRSALEGDLSENTYVQNGDTIFIPKAKTFFISGEVSSPGKYILEKDTTVRNAISLAGGETEKASLVGIKIIRKKEDGKKEEIEVEIDALVNSEDTIIIPESFF